MTVVIVRGKLKIYILNMKYLLVFSAKKKDVYNLLYGFHLYIL